MKLSKLDKTAIVVILWFIFSVTSSLTTGWLVKNGYIELVEGDRVDQFPTTLGFIFFIAFVSFMGIAIARIVHIWQD